MKNPSPLGCMEKQLREMEEQIQKHIWKGVKFCDPIKKRYPINMYVGIL